MKTIVVQSYRTDHVPVWIEQCLESVRRWTEAQGWAYRFIGDEIFDRVPSWFRERAGGRIPIITDLARLVMAKQALSGAYERYVWLDADVLIFDPAGLRLTVTEGYAFGWEIWVQSDGAGGLKVYRNVHNAVSVFCRDNAMLDFYIHASETILARSGGSVPPQVVGTKLLTALHNMIGLPLIEDVGMLSPLVIGDLVAGGGSALARLQKECRGPLRAANLCSSLVGSVSDGVDLTHDTLANACAALVERGPSLFAAVD